MKFDMIQFGCVVVVFSSATSKKYEENKSIVKFPALAPALQWFLGKHR